MAQTYGPKYPGIEDGLIWSWDPKNRNCWDGGTDGIGYPDWTNRSSGTNNIVLTDTDTGFTNGAMESEGYFHFDGTDDQLFINDSWQDLYGNSTGYPFSVSAWCKADAVSTRAWIVGSEGSGWGTGMFMLRFEDSDNVNYGGSNNAVFNVDGWNDNMCTGSVTFTDWNNIVGTCDSSRNIKIYVNGVAGSTNTADEPGIVYTFAVGGGNNVGSRAFDGKIGPCAIWNRVLSAGEVLTNYNRLKGRFGL